MHLGSWKSGDEEKRLLRIKASQLESALEEKRQRRRESEENVRDLELTTLLTHLRECVIIKVKKKIKWRN